MDDYRVKDLMVPLSEYATVPKGATLFDAVLALEKAQEDFDHTKYRHRAVLILDEKKQVVGKLSQLNVLRALEPQDDETVSQSIFQNYGFSEKFIQHVRKMKRMQNAPLETAFKAAGRMPVEAFMQAPSEGEHVDEDTSLEMAIHQLVSGHHLSLLVTRKNGIVGLLRLTDVFAAVFHAMKEYEESA